MSASEEREERTGLSVEREVLVQEDRAILLQRIDALEKKVEELEEKLQEKMNAQQQDNKSSLQSRETETETENPPDQKEEALSEEMNSPSAEESLSENLSEQPEILKKTFEASENVTPEPESSDEHAEEAPGQAASEQREPEHQQPNQEENAMTVPEDHAPVQEEPKMSEEQPAAEAASEFEVEALIAAARKKEHAQLEEDQQQYGANLEEAVYWQDLGQTLVPEIKRAADAAQTLIAESQHLVAALPDDVQKALKNHQEGFEIIGRMLDRLVTPGERLKKLAEESEIPGELNAIAEDQWRTLLEEVTDKELALKKIQQTLKNIGKENYRIVSQSNDLVKNRKNLILSFLGKQVLPILDGIYDGQKHLTPRMAELQQRYAEQSSELAAWFELYGKLANEIEQVLERGDVHEIDVVPGAAIDFERHEPFAVEPEPDMENEQIKEVARKGYEYTTPDGERQVLRAAQVVVVKNENETKES